MGKLHKIRQDYNQLEAKDKTVLTEVLKSGTHIGKFPDKAREFYVKYEAGSGWGMKRGVKYYVLHLLKQDGFLKKTQTTSHSSYFGGKQIARYY